jgi:uncharacterized protein
MTASPPVADGQTRPLDPRVVALDRLVGAISVLVLAGALLVVLLIVVFTRRVADWAMPFAALTWAAAVLGLAYRAYKWPEVAYRHASYRVDARGIEVRRGVIWRRVITVPRSRVQHTDVAQGPLERSYGLGTLLIHTAGTDFARVQLHGLHYETASRIRDHLLPDEGPDAV